MDGQKPPGRLRSSGEIDLKQVEKAPHPSWSVDPAAWEPRRAEGRDDTGEARAHDRRQSVSPAASAGEITPSPRRPCARAMRRLMTGPAEGGGTADHPYPGFQRGKALAHRAMEAVDPGGMGGGCLLSRGPGVPQPVRACPARAMRRMISTTWCVAVCLITVPLTIPLPCALHILAERPTETSWRRRPSVCEDQERTKRQAPGSFPSPGADQRACDLDAHAPPLPAARGSRP